MSIYSIPFSFSKLEESDNRFTRVKILVASVGENKNCYFSKEVLESFKEQIEGIPILAMLKENQNGDLDFDSHGGKLLNKNGALTWTYVGHAYGFIPKDNNAQFEMLYDDMGVKREYLTCEGYIWNKFHEVVELLKNPKGQSLELLPSESHGYRNEEGVFIYEKAVIDGLCILGDHITPAINGAKIYNFSDEKTSITEELREMITEFSSYEKEMLNLDKEKESIIENQEEEKEVVEQEEEEVEQKEEEKEVEKPTEFSQKELSFSEMKSEIYKLLESKERYGYISEMFLEYFYYQEGSYDENDEWTNKVYKIKYEFVENKPVLKEEEEIVLTYLTLEEKEKVENERKERQELEAKLKELTEFKSKVEFAEKESYLSNFSEKLSKDNYEKIKQGLVNFASVEDVKKDIALALFEESQLEKPVEFSSDEVAKVKPLEVKNPIDEASKIYGSMAKYFY